MCRSVSRVLFIGRITCFYLLQAHNQPVGQDVLLDGSGMLVLDSWTFIYLFIDGRGVELY